MCARTAAKVTALEGLSIHAKVPAYGQQLGLELDVTRTVTRIFSLIQLLVFFSILLCSTALVAECGM